MLEISQNAIWPGVLGVESCEYVCSHGIKPGRAVIQTIPQVSAPALTGNLTFSDGKRTIIIPDCKVTATSSSYSPQGQSYYLEISDRRWRWSFGGVSGNYNQKDDNGKLVPWSIRSPQELAALCLKEMKERNPLVILPAGLPRQAGANLDRYLRRGQNYPQTLTNPEQVWDHTNPAQALSRLVELWGCHVIYQPIMDRVLIAPLGSGRSFPNMPCEVVSGNVDGVPSPSYVAAYSSDPIAFQLRFLTEAVGKEWDGTYVPIDELSYAPVCDTNVKQISEIFPFLSVTDRALGVRLTWVSPFTKNEISTYETSSAAGTTNAKMQRIADRLNADPDVAPIFTITVTGTTMRFVAKGKLSAFSADASKNPDGSEQWCCTREVQKGGDVKNTWANCPPPFLNVQATDRLSVIQARGLAEESVFKCYRIRNVDPHAKFQKGVGRTIELPIVGNIVRRQQIVLQETKVEQVIPAPRIPGAINKNNKLGAQAPGIIPGGGVLPEFYNGYSRAQEATATGSVWKFLSGTSVFYWIDPNNKNKSENTEEEDRVFVGFGVNAKEQLIKFNSPVYRFAPSVQGMTYLEVPKIILETSCYVLSSETNQFVKWEEFLKIPNGTGPIEWVQREDMRVGLIARYIQDNKILQWDYDGVQDAKQRAGYYLRGLATQYQVKGGEVRNGIGIYAHDPDGYCQQVTWRIGDGATTILSGNTEEHPWVSTYPARRREENLPPDKSAAIANKIEREGWDKNKAG